MHGIDSPSSPDKMDKSAFFKEAVAAFTAGIGLDDLHQQTQALAISLRGKLSDLHSLSMLPSFIDRSPTGQEHGRAISVDIGGSTMRVAVVRLDHQRCLVVENYQKWVIDQDVKHLDGVQFFDWIAGNIKAFLKGHPDGLGQPGHQSDLFNAPMGLVWSFPLNQTQLDDGELREMGKGFKVGTSLMGSSINSCMTAAFQRADLPLRLEAILNDSVSALLAMMYLKPSAQLSVVAGTGFNGAVKLPVSALALGKFGQRSPDWIQSAQHVLVDAELCVTGQGIFPQTKWDLEILESMPHVADLLGLEVLVGGLFLGELFRRVIVDALQKSAFMDDQLPKNISEPYSLRLEIVTVLLTEASDEELYDKAGKQLSTALGLTTLISREDLLLLQDLSRALMTRTAAFVAVAASAVKTLHDEEFQKDAAPRIPEESSCVVSCTGSVIEKCPGFMEQAQAYINNLHMRSASSESKPTTGPQLVLAAESSLTGVAVAALMARLRNSSEQLVTATGEVLMADSSIESSLGSFGQDAAVIFASKSDAENGSGGPATMPAIHNGDGLPKSKRQWWKKTSLYCFLRGCFGQP